MATRRKPEANTSGFRSSQDSSAEDEEESHGGENNDKEDDNNDEEDDNNDEEDAVGMALDSEMASSISKEEEKKDGLRKRGNKPHQWSSTDDDTIDSAPSPRHGAEQSPQRESYYLRSSVLARPSVHTPHLEERSARSPGTKTSPNSKEGAVAPSASRSPSQKGPVASPAKPHLATSSAAGDRRAETTANMPENAAAKKHTATGDAGGMIKYYVLFAIVIVAFGMFLVWGFRRQNQTPLGNNVPSPFATFLKSLAHLKQTFPTQNDTKVWKVLRVGTRPIIEAENPDTPAVFIFVVPDGAGRTADCVARKFAQLVAESTGGKNDSVEFRADTARGTPEEIKKEIDDELRSGFNLGKRSALIHRLDRLHGRAAMMFHSYCDNENAAHRRVAIIFTLHVDAREEGERAGEEREYESDTYVERVLGKMWGDQLEKDRLEPLYSRIGNLNVFIRRESDAVLADAQCAQ